MDCGERAATDIRAGASALVWVRGGIELRRIVQHSIYEQVVERDQGACQDCLRAAHHIHHIIPRGWFGKNGKHRGEVVSNLICLCRSCHERAHTKVARRRHLTLLRERWGYVYDTQPWLGVLGEA